MVLGCGCGGLSSSSSESDESGRREANGLGLAKREEREANAVGCLVRRGSGGIVRVTRGLDQVIVGGEWRDTTGNGNTRACGLSLLAREGRFAPRTSCAQVASPACTIFLVLWTKTRETRECMRDKERKTERQTHRWSYVGVAPAALRVRGSAHARGVLWVGGHHTTVRTVVADVPAMQPTKERARTSCLLSCWSAKKS